jgi:hypothetical protein
MTLRFQVLMIAGMEMTDFWDELFSTLMMEAVRTSDTSACFNETTRHYIPEHCHLHSVSHYKHKDTNAV